MFFSYEVNEALHLSERERTTFINCLMKIQEELKHFIDRLSKCLIANNTELLLDRRIFSNQLESPVHMP